MTYNNCPVFVGEAQTDSILETQAKSFQLLTRNVSVDYSTSINTQRKLKKSAVNQFEYTGPLNAKLSFDFLLHTDVPQNESGYLFLYDTITNGSKELGSATGTNYFPIKVGDNLFKKCYLDDYAISIKPLEPVLCSATFTSFDAPSKQSISGNYSFDSYVNNNLSSEKIIHGYNCVVNGASQAISENVITSISYKKNYKKTPIFTIGSSLATKQLLDAAEAEVTIESTGINALIDYSGDTLSSNVTISLQDNNAQKINPYSTDLTLNISAGAAIHAQKYSVAEGDSVVSAVSMREIIV